MGREKELHGLVGNGDDGALVPQRAEADVPLETLVGPDTFEKQTQNLQDVAKVLTGLRITFTWEIESSPNFDACSIMTNAGRNITLDRGLDILQRFESGPFSASKQFKGFG